MKSHLVLGISTALATLSFAAPADPYSSSGKFLADGDIQYHDHIDILDPPLDDTILQATTDRVAANANVDVKPSDVAVTVAPDLAANPPNNPVLLHLQMGSLKQHVGYKFGEELEKDVLKCLNDLCPKGQLGCTLLKHCTIGSIAYNNHGHLAQNAWLSFYVARASFPSGYYGLREKLISIVAKIYKLQSENMKNCYDVTINDKAERMCNTGGYVIAELAHWRGKNHEFIDTGAKLDVNLLFNGPTREGQFDCVGSETPIVERIDWNDYLDRIGDIIGEPPGAVKLWVDCPDPSVDRRDLAPATTRSVQKRTLQKRTKNTIHIGLGSQRQHMGDLSGQDMWNRINACLVDLCPDNHCKSDPCKLEGITLNVKDAYSHSSFERVEVKLNNIPDKYPGMREALFEQVAGIYKLFTEDAKNCYDDNFKEKGRVQICNVPEAVIVRIDQLAWLLVKVTWQFPTTQGTVDCFATKEAVGKFLDDNVREDFAKSMGLSKDDLGSYIVCENPK